MVSFEILPAIDLHEGRVVRLRRGAFESATAHSDDPASVARSFVQAGAGWIHVVDLDGARAGGPVHGDAIAAIVDRVGPRGFVEVGGGLRTAADVATILGRGVRRAVLGTAAIAEARLVADLVRTWGTDRLAVAVDVLDGRTRGQGWSVGGDGPRPVDLVAGLADVGINVFEVTAIDRDGMLGGPDLELLATMVDLRAGDVIASGGIRSVTDLRAVRSIGCAGAIVGRALYEGQLELADAIRSISGPGDLA